MGSSIDGSGVGRELDVSATVCTATTLGSWGSWCLSTMEIRTGPSVGMVLDVVRAMRL